MPSRVKEFERLRRAVFLGANQVGHGNTPPPPSAATNKQLVFPRSEVEPLFDQRLVRRLLVRLGILNIIKLQIEMRPSMGFHEISRHLAGIEHHKRMPLIWLPLQEEACRDVATDANVHSHSLAIVAVSSDPFSTFAR